MDVCSVPGIYTYIHTSLRPCVHTPSKIHGWQNYLWTGLSLLCTFCRLRGDVPAHRFVPSLHSFSSRLHTVFLWLTTPPPLLPPVQWWQKGLHPLSPGQACPLEFRSLNICAFTTPQGLFWKSCLGLFSWYNGSNFFFFRILLNAKWTWN